MSTSYGHERFLFEPNWTQSASEQVLTRQEILKPVALAGQRIHVQLQFLRIEEVGLMLYLPDQSIFLIESKRHELVQRISLPYKPDEAAPPPQRLGLRPEQRKELEFSLRPYSAYAGRISYRTDSAKACAADLRAVFTHAGCAKVDLEHYPYGGDRGLENFNIGARDKEELKRLDIFRRAGLVAHEMPQAEDTAEGLLVVFVPNVT